MRVEPNEGRTPMPAPTDLQNPTLPGAREAPSGQREICRPLKGISEDTFKKQYGHLIERTSPRRQTVKLGDVLGD